MRAGKIDIHSHLLPAIDDGCRELDDSYDSVERLIEMGFVGTVCTPHVWPRAYPGNTPAAIDQMVRQMRQRLSEEGLDYQLWSGGELRLWPKAVAWCKENGVPTLGDSKHVLVDFWEDTWPRYANKTMDWLRGEGYTVVLAHPERLGVGKGLEAKLESLMQQGVLLQGNLRCFTGEEGPRAQDRAKAWLERGWYHVLALDMHGPERLEGRLAGLAIVESLVGPAQLKRLTEDVPRELLGLAKSG